VADFSADTYAVLVRDTVAGACGTDKQLEGWTAHSTIPGPGDPVATSKDIYIDLLEEGDGVMSDGSGYGVVLGLLLVKARTIDAVDGDRETLAQAVYKLRELLRTTPGTRPDKVVVSYRSWGTIGDIPVVSAEVEIERRIHTS
jgi:hypothetical protein